MWSSLDQKGGFLPEIINLDSSINLKDAAKDGRGGRNGKFAQSMALKSNTNQTIAE